MFWTYLLAVFRKALSTTTRVTDGLQILTASVLPGVAKFLGVTMPESIGNDALAYIGAAALAFIVIRLFWAPYALWKEQVETVDGLKIELSKPQQMIMVRLAKHRAKARAKLAAKLEDYQTIAFSENWTDGADIRSAKAMTKIRRLQAEAGLSEAFNEGRKTLMLLVMAEANKADNAVTEKRGSQHVLELLQRHLVGDVTAEALALQLPKGTELEKQL